LFRDVSRRLAALARDMSPDASINFAPTSSRSAAASGRAASSRRTTATSASHRPDRLLMTPASVSKGFMTPEMMVVTDLDGRWSSGAPGRSRRPRS
jgi:ribulose-5-phosphate 4-epimerase/fuculose-1-phosphate aldolase